jgi:tRNA pseudouridine synthase 10
MNLPPPAKIFLEGRYRKLCRDLPQTVFFCPACKGHPRRREGCPQCEGFGKLTKDSVQELVSWVVGKAFGTRRNKFHGAGREDIDVRMLGRGRPFVLELEAPKLLDLDLAELEAEVNRRNAGRLEIEGLHYAEKGRVAYLKETPHAKRYRALVQLSEPRSGAAFAPHLGRRIEISQRTPKRVAHRRADLERTRWIELRSATPVEPDGSGQSSRFEIELDTQHGTYVKEALSGEQGATRPGLPEWVGCTGQCLELDVLEILGVDGGQEPVLERPPAFGSGI